MAVDKQLLEPKETQVDNYHVERATELLEDAMSVPYDERRMPPEQVYLTMAQVHATLALADVLTKLLKQQAFRE